MLTPGWGAPIDAALVNFLENRNLWLCMHIVMHAPRRKYQAIISSMRYTRISHDGPE